MDMQIMQTHSIEGEGRSYIIDETDKEMNGQMKKICYGNERTEGKT